MRKGLENYDTNWLMFTFDNYQTTEIILYSPAVEKVFIIETNDEQILSQGFSSDGKVISFISKNFLLSLRSF